MQISNIQFLPISSSNSSDGFLGFVKFNLEDKLHCESIGVYTRPTGGIRLLFPTKKSGSGEEFQTFYPINNNFRRKLEKEVEGKIKEVMET